MVALRVLSLWLHLLAVTVWVGGAVGWALVLLTADRPQSTDARLSWIENLGRWFLTLGWEALGVIVLTGIFNLLPRVQSGEFFESAYLTSFLVKLGLVGGMVGLQLWQHGWLVSRLRTDSWSRARKYSVIASGVFIGLATGVIWIGIHLRFV